MGRTKMKWTDTGADFVSATPRAAAGLRQITDPALPRPERRTAMADARNSITLASGRRYDGPLYPIGEPSKRSPVTDSAPPTAAPARRGAAHPHPHPRQFVAAARGASADPRCGGAAVDPTPGSAPRSDWRTSV
jgi:hypothetical protein